ncbi:MAG: hypothetical protein HQL55_19000, partial [Magnetococcales bacterium]|nr:hypothetical protein [Magnetococcales bacterium]
MSDTPSSALDPQPYPVATIPVPPAEEGEIDIFKLWDMLVAGKKLILISIVLCTALAMLIAFTTKPVYKAEVLLLP